MRLFIVGTFRDRKSGETHTLEAYTEHINSKGRQKLEANLQDYFLADFVTMTQGVPFDDYSEYYTLMTLTAYEISTMPFLIQNQLTKSKS